MNGSAGSDAYIAKLTQHGQLIWEKSLRNGESEFFGGLIKIQDEYILTMPINIWYNDKVKNNLVRLDVSGNLIEEKLTTDWGYWYYLNNLRRSKGGILITGTNYTEWDNGNLIGSHRRGGNEVFRLQLGRTMASGIPMTKR